MTRIGRNIFLGVEIEEIYGVLTDADRITDWFEHIAGTDIEGEFPQPDSKLNIVFKYGDVVLNYAMTVMEFVEGEYAIFKLEGDLVGTQRWTTTPVRGGYRLTIDYDYESPVLGLDKVVERITRKTLDTSLHNLKGLLETNETPAYF
jgi:hypothetical protein